MQSVWHSFLAYHGITSDVALAVSGWHPEEGVHFATLVGDSYTIISG